jgi:beta-phosphoglucomutase family hydrolase
MQTMLKFDISPNAKGLIFDLDGTLINTMSYHFQAWQMASKDYGMEMTREFLSNVMGGAALVIAEKFIASQGKTGRVEPSEIIEKKGQYYKQLVHKVTPIDEVLDIVKKYHGVLPMAIGTGGSRSSVALSLEQTGVGSYFDIIVTSDDVVNHKPAPDTFLKCAELINVEPEFCEVFEDGVPGLKAANSAGMIPTDVREWFDPKW